MKLTLKYNRTFKHQFYEGDILEVIQGPFQGYNVEVITVQGDKILGQLDMFGRTVPAEFTKNQLYKHDKPILRILTISTQSGKWISTATSTTKKTSGISDMMVRLLTGTTVTKINS
jgi:hypothetical protein